MNNGDIITKPGYLKVSSPWSVQVTKKKKFSPNLNQYRNAHYRTLSKVKKDYAKIITDQLDTLDVLPRFNKVSVLFISYPPTRRRTDPDNLVVHLKFAMDAIVSRGVLEDDHYGIVKELKFKFGEIDKENPRVDIILEEYVDD